MSRAFTIPGEIITGTGALNTAQKSLGNMGTKALIVTDAMMVELGNSKKVEEALFRENIPYATYAGITGEPTDTMVEEGAALYREEQCDFLIALGGGSPIDAMKAIGVLTAGEGRITDYSGKIINTKIPPMAAIPTTAGTGSEATQFTIITDTENSVKMLLKGQVLMPDLAIIDPQFTVSVPANITAWTGLDALTHAVEAYTSLKAQPMSDTFAISAIKRIYKYLPLAFQNGKDTKAREQMAIAALEAGIAFNNASVTVIHGMSRPIGAIFHVPHGLSNAMLLNECLSFIADKISGHLALLAREIGVAGQQDTDWESSQKFLAVVRELCINLEIPGMVEFGIDKDEYINIIDKMANDALASKSPQNTRKDLSPEDIKKIYRNAIDSE